MERGLRYVVSSWREKTGETPFPSGVMLLSKQSLVIPAGRRFQPLRTERGTLRLISSAAPRALLALWPAGTLPDEPVLYGKISLASSCFHNTARTHPSQGCRICWLHSPCPPRASWRWNLPEATGLLSVTVIAVALLLLLLLRCLCLFSQVGKEVLSAARGFATQGLELPTLLPLPVIIHHHGAE